MELTDSVNGMMPNAIGSDRMNNENKGVIE